MEHYKKFHDTTEPVSTYDPTHECERCNCIVYTYKSEHIFCPINGKDYDPVCKECEDTSDVDIITLKRYCKILEEYIPNVEYMRTVFEDSERTCYKCHKKFILAGLSTSKESIEHYKCMLLNTPDYVNMKANNVKSDILILAAIYLEYDVVKYLLEKGYDVNTKQGYSFSTCKDYDDILCALNFISSDSSLNEFGQIETKKIQKLLLEYGAETQKAYEYSQWL